MGRFVEKSGVHDGGIHKEEMLPETKTVVPTSLGTNTPDISESRVVRNCF